PVWTETKARPFELTIEAVLSRISRKSSTYSDPIHHVDTKTRRIVTLTDLQELSIFFKDARHHNTPGVIRRGGQFLPRDRRKRRTNNDPDMECGGLSPLSF